MKRLLCILILGMLYAPAVLGAPNAVIVEKSGVSGGIIEFSKEDFLSVLPAEDSVKLTTVRFYGVPDSETGTLVTASGVLTDGEPVSVLSLDTLCYQSYQKGVHKVAIFWNAESGDTILYEEGELILTLTAEESPAPPEDTPEEKPEEIPQPIYVDMNRHWGEYSAKKLFDEGVWVGEKLGANRYFYPETKTTRLDFLLAMIATLEENYNDVQSATPIFADEHLYADYVIKPAKWAYEKGILSGNLQNGMRYLNPYEPISRAEAATLINRALQLQVPKSRSDLAYADQAQIPSWAEESIRDLRGYGVMKGFTDNTFRPYNKINRAESAEVLVQLRKLVLEEDVLSAQLLS